MRCIYKFGYLIPQLGGMFDLLVRLLRLQIPVESWGDVAINLDQV